MKCKRAFITGAYGQDGSYLAEYLLGLEYEVLGLVHEADIQNPNGDFLKDKENFSVCIGDICDLESFVSVLTTFAPDEVYNLAAISDLKTARENQEMTKAVNFHAFQSMVAHVTARNSRIRIFQALSSRILQADKQGVITESSLLAEPKNAYDEAKRDSHEKVVLEFRKRGYFVASGFLCNHESPRRGDRFVTGKIAKCVTNIGKGLEEKLEIGNIEAKRDWSFALDVVRAMHATLQAAEPYDYVIGAGELHSVKEFIEIAFQVVGKRIAWNGEGVDTCGYDDAGVLRVIINPEFYQPDDNPVMSDTRFLEEKTSWKRQTSFHELVEMMVRAEGV